VLESDQKRPKLSIIGGAAGGWAPPHVLVPLQHRCPKTARRSNESRCQLPTVEGRRDTQKGDCRPLVLACCCLLGVLNWQISFHTNLKLCQRWKTKMVATFLCVVHGRRAAKKSWRNNRNHQADVLLSARDTRGAGNNYGPTIAITVKPPTLRGFQDARTPTTPSTNSWHGQKHTRREREGNGCTGKKPHLEFAYQK